MVRFARATGDLHSLSPPDIKLIALTYTLEAELYGTAHIRREPPPIAVAKKSQARMKDPPGWGKVANPADWAGIDEVGDDGKRPGSSGGFGKGGSRILGVKPLEGDRASVAISNAAGEVLSSRAGLALEEVSTSLSKIGLEGGLKLGDSPAGLPEVGVKDQGVGNEEQGGELVSGENTGEESKLEGKEGEPEGKESIPEGKESIPEGEGGSVGSQGTAAWGGFTVAPPVAVPLASNSLRSTEPANDVDDPQKDGTASPAVNLHRPLEPANDGGAPQAVGTASQAEAAPRRNGRQGFKRGGGRGGGRGRGGRSKPAAPTKAIVVDGVHAVLVEEQAIEHAGGGDEWERNVSRSTRRKHQRRVERAAGLETPGGVNAGAAKTGAERAAGLETLGGVNAGGVNAGASAGEGPSDGAEAHVGTESKAEENKGDEAKAESEAAETSKGVGSKEAGWESKAAAESGQQSEEPAAAKRPSGVGLGGQFSDAEEDEETSVAEESVPEAESPAADVTDPPADVSKPTDLADSGEPSATVEYEYVYSDQQKAPETAEVTAPEASEGASEVGSGWDGASTAAGPERESEVACMTADFAMQNVLLQMGLRLLSVDGLAISQVHR